MTFGSPIDYFLMASLAVHTVLLIMLGVFFFYRLRKAGQLLNTFQQEWDSAQSSHRSLMDHARESVETLLPAAAGRRNSEVRNRASLKAELRDNIAALSKKG